MNDRMKNFFMGMAKQCASMSRAKRLQVGAVVTKENNIISFSWNGMPAGWDNNCEDETVELYSGYEGAIHRTVLKTKPEVLHAERNALDKLAKRGGTGGDNAVMFSTHAPCLECAKSIYGSGISEVYYGEDYRSEDGINFLKTCGVKIEKVIDSVK